MEVQKNMGLGHTASQQKPASFRAPASRSGESSQGLQAEVAISRIWPALTPSALRSYPFFACSMPNLLPNLPAPPILSSQIDTVSFSIFFNSHNTL